MLKLRFVAVSLHPKKVCLDLFCACAVNRLHSPLLPLELKTLDHELLMCK